MTLVFAGIRRLPRLWLKLAAITAVAGIGVADYLTGYEVSLSIFYLGVISSATWFVNRRFAMAMCVLSVTCWLTGDLAAVLYFLWTIIHLCGNGLQTSSIARKIWSFVETRTMRPEHCRPSRR